MNWEFLLITAVILAVGAFLWLELRYIKHVVNKINSNISDIKTESFVNSTRSIKPNPTFFNPNTFNPNTFNQNEIINRSEEPITMKIEKINTNPEIINNLNSSNLEDIELQTETTSALEEEIKKYEEELKRIEEESQENLRKHSEPSERSDKSKEIPSEAFSSGKRELISKDIFNDHVDLDTPGINGDELMEHLLNDSSDLRNLKKDDERKELASIMTTETDISEGRIDLYQKLMKDNNLDSLKNMCRLYNIPLKGNKKELSKKLLDNEKFVREHNKVYKDNLSVVKLE